MANDSRVQETHRPGLLKQQNKSHKTGRHRSKGEIQKDAKGRVNVKAVSKKKNVILDRQQRRNKAVQLRRLKREEAVERKRSRGGAGSPPFLVAVVSLHTDVNTEDVLGLLETCDGVSATRSGPVTLHVSVARFKQRFTFVLVPHGNLYWMLDVAKVADCVLLLTTADCDKAALDDDAELCLSALFAQGLPSVTIAIQGLKNLPIKKQSDTRKLIAKSLEKRFPEERLYAIDTDQDALLLLRTIGNQKLRRIAQREHRAHLIADSYVFESTTSSEQGTTAEVGTLKVSGYIRGQALSANSLVHITGWGDFQLSCIEAPPDPHPLVAQAARVPRKTGGAMETDDETLVRVLETADPAVQQSLESEAVVNDMDAEQTWPTEQELQNAEADFKLTRKVVKRVPKGMSEYQAAWIVDNDAGDNSEVDDDDDDDDDDNEAMDADKSTASQVDSASSGDENDNADELESQVTVNDDEKYDATVDVEEDTAAMKKYKAARLDEMFPDETDTPMDLPARVRFQKYRGLKSFRTSPWDPREDLPSDYARIYQFENFRNTRRRVLQADHDVGALPGWYVTLSIVNVPRAVVDSLSSIRPLVVFSPLLHEQKMSVLHFLVKRRHGDDEPIESKERMVFNVGYRRFAACPIYSQHTNANKHKSERFLRTDVAMVATVFAPIMFPPASVLMFKEMSEGDHKLIATGSLLTVDPDRVITKRIVLSGHPFKINRRSAVVRYMLFNRDDIMWFKPVELRTKWGRRGHIREPLGTHGHMKCVFDGQLKSQDTVMMQLYKRVYPKWTYDPHVPDMYCRAQEYATSTDMLDIFT